MFEFFAQYGMDILAMVIGVGASGFATYLWAKSKKIAKYINEKITKSDENNQVTQEGIVEAFKQAIIPNELRISINEKVEEVVGEFCKNFLSKYDERAENMENATMCSLIIMRETAAYNKLSVEDKELVNQIIDLYRGKLVPTISTTQKTNTNTNTQ